ncbi:MAG: adenylate/guanylate cyclase domain-containing protein [Elusimicrobia bacterium]|nr:adenylate/guanylate cyclase domain-containing protein [Elusimicrobiota bacterium]
MKQKRKTKKFISSRQFFNILRSRNSRNVRSIDKKIKTLCGTEMAVMVLDSSGFSRKTHEHGIIEFMDNMTECHDKMEDMVRKFKGSTLSSKADNLIAVFEKTDDAVKCAMEINYWLRERNKKLTEIKQYNVCTGIHFGELLRLKDDAYGSAVNVAFKLGEDIAGKDEILVTESAYKTIKDRFNLKYSRHTTIGGVAFDIYKVEW